MTIQENVTGLGHLGIPAIDLEKTVKWYTELLGFEVIYDGMQYSYRKEIL